MKHILLIATAVLPMLCSAQLSTNKVPTDAQLAKPTAKEKIGVYKAQKVKGKITGTGVLRLKNGDTYIGDFNDKVIHGKGIYVPAEGGEIAGCPGAAVYVGRFKGGVKAGKGTCYDASGNVIYSGKFVADAPAETYPNPVEDVSYLSGFMTPEFYYIGEMAGENPDGFGALLFDNGGLLVSHFADGERTGLTTYISESGEWFTENIENGETIPISSSSEYSALSAQRKAMFLSGLREALDSFAQAASCVVDAGLIIEASAKVAGFGMQTASNYNAAVAQYHDANSNYSKKATTVSGPSTDSKNSLSEQRRFNADKSTYNRYDSMLAQAFAGNRNASQSEIEDWQSKMKALRAKWDGSGKNFPHSANEDR